MLMSAFEAVRAMVGAWAEWTRLGLETAGALSIAIGAITTIVEMTRHALAREHVSFTSARFHLSRYLALALEFQLAGDILETAIAPEWTKIGKFARSFIAFSSGSTGARSSAIGSIANRKYFMPAASTAARSASASAPPARLITLRMPRRFNSGMAISREVIVPPVEMVSSTRQKLLTPAIVTRCGAAAAIQTCVATARLAHNNVRCFMTREIIS